MLLKGMRELGNSQGGAGYGCARHGGSGNKVSSGKSFYIFAIGTHGISPL
jgi:hypothetical protein